MFIVHSAMFYDAEKYPIGKRIWMRAKRACARVQYHSGSISWHPVAVRAESFYGQIAVVS